MPVTSEIHTDVVVIGAGPAGAAAASIIKRAGYDVVVYERSTFPRFVIGESLLPRCMDLLTEAGLYEAAAAQGFQRKNGATFLRGDNERCDLDFGDQFTDGWDHTWQVQRDVFDHALVKAAEASHGVPFHFRHTVIDATVGAEPSVIVEDDKGDTREVRCRFIVDASGYGRVLPRLLGLNRPSALPPRRCVFTHVTGDRRPEGDLEGNIWIVSDAGNAWLWVIPFSDGSTSVGVIGEPAYFDSLPTDPDACLRAIIDANPATAPRLGEARFKRAATVIEGYSIGVERLFDEGFCLVGNTMEFLDPVFSSGVTLALESAVCAAKILVRQLGGEEVSWQTEYADHIMQGVEVFRTYVDAWYDGTLPSIFYAPDANPTIKRMLCSVLAGYAWDLNNPYVREHRRKTRQLGRIVTLKSVEGASPARP